MATYNKFNATVEHLAEGVHDLGADQLVAFLTTHANIPVVGNSVLGDLTTISYTNLSSRNITTSTSSQTSGTYKLVLTDLVLTASGAVATFRHAGYYNDTPTSPADPLLGWWDYGSDVTLASGETFTYDFDATNGVIQIA
jgi:hypothetical protein